MIYLRNSLVVMILAGTLSAVGFSQQSAVTLQPKIGNPKLRKELLAMAEVDQKARNELISKMSFHTMDSTVAVRMDSIDRAHTKRIKEMINECGWPGRSVTGEDGAEAAFLIVQHSPDTLFQRSCLPLVEAAFKTGEVPGGDLALLTDRVRVREGKPQLYGSQTTIVDGKLVLDPIEDEANVDKRRAQLGLVPMSEYVKILKQLYHLEVK